jgi:anti-sigma regulatory factor (Ser/Thr protein kinase)
MAGFEHDALMYSDLGEYVKATCAFIDGAREADQPVMVAVPGQKIGVLREGLNGAADGVRFVDMNKLGRNPGRIIPEVREWVGQQGRRRCHFVGEPIWPGRSGEETIEATRHEALINLAFADADAHILCPYDTRLLNREVVADARRTHPHLIEGDRRHRSDCYTDPLEIWRAEEWKLTKPTRSVATFEINEDLASLRAFTAGWARRCGLAERRVPDFVFAINEAATNALLHGRPPARLRAWLAGDRVVAEITDAGRLENPLAGRFRPRPAWPSGRGVWLINQMCDLVELRPADAGTTIRMHVRVG